MGTPSRHRGAWHVGWVAALLLLAGCGPFARGEDTPLELNFAEVLPAGWVALGTWHEVNIDGDRADEYLLFFRYDNGQVGAVIYDTRLTSNLVGNVEVGATPPPTVTVELVPVPLQSFGYFRPYRLLPSSWAFTYSGSMGQGFVAPPEDSGEVYLYQIGPPSSALRLTPGPSGGPEAELLLRGGNIHLTFVWWRDPVSGYGVTQLVAAGGFRGIDWEAYAQSPKPLTTLLGLYPLADYRARSLLCREIAYTRVGIEEPSTEPADLRTPAPPTESAPGAPAVDYVAADRGLHFCYDPMPAQPFYPEGVVMAYLLDGRNHEQAAATRITPGVTLAQVDAEAGCNRLAEERIDDVATYPTVPVQGSNLLSGEFAPITTVCVELAEAAEPQNRRWLLFTLHYQPPDLEERLPERWTISGAATAPQPVAYPGPAYCDSILRGQAPASQP